MPIDRKLYKLGFYKFPSWPCPACDSGILVLDKSKFHAIETGPSKSAFNHEAWEPDWIDKRFVGLLFCQNPDCGEIVAMSGKATGDWHYETKPDGTWEQTIIYEYYPCEFYPGPAIFRVPHECPEVVSAPIVRAFSLFWFDASACANALRSACEALLNDQKGKRYTINKENKRVSLALHSRIENFQRDYNSDAGDFLLAIKWLGNTGSHNSERDVSRDDLLSGFELYEQVLQDVYTKHRASLSAKAKALTRGKGRTSPKGRRSR